MYSWDAGRMNAALASRLLSASLASMLMRDAALTLLIIASGQRRLKITGLPGPVPRGARLLYLTRCASFALTFGEWGFRRASLVNLAFGLPNANFTCQVWYAGLSLASYFCWAIGRSNL